MTEQQTSAREGATTCRICGSSADEGVARTDISGHRYCVRCFEVLRHTPAGRNTPWFRCSVCGQPAAPQRVTDLDGRVVCKDCFDHRGSSAAAGNDATASPEQTAQEISQRLEYPLPRGLLPKLTCPHCWHAFSPEQVVWISQHADLLGDPILGPEAQARFRPSRFNVLGEALDLRDMPCQQLACPRCHLPVPRAILEAHPLFFSIIGSPASGKSHFLAAMSWSLRRLLSERFGIVFNDADTLSNRALQEYEETLFLQDDPDRLVAIRKTELQGEMYDQIRLGEQIISLPRPFLFTLRPRDKGRVRLICLYDNAGEHFQPGMDTIAAPGTQHLARSRALMFVYDPTQDPRFRQRCRPISNDPQLQGSPRTQRQETILNEAAARVRRYTGLSPHKKHARPMVVIVSKSDVWGQLIQADLSTEPLVATHDGAAWLDAARVEVVSSELRSLLAETAPEFVTAAEDFAQQVVYIPVSALGGSPRVQEKTGMLGIRPKDIRPQWVTVPMLYMFSKWTSGLVPQKPAGTP